MSLRREIKAYVEAELRDYNDTLRSIAEERDELILQSPVHDNNGGKSYDIGDPTQDKTFKLMTNKRIKRMEDTCRAIERIINELPEEKYKLVTLRYWTRPRCLTDNGIARELNVGIATYYRWTDEILKGVAIELGLVNAVS